MDFDYKTQKYIQELHYTDSAHEILDNKTDSKQNSSLNISSTQKDTENVNNVDNPIFLCTPVNEKKSYRSMFASYLNPEIGNEYQQTDQNFFKSATLFDEYEQEYNVFIKKSPSAELNLHQSNLTKNCNSNIEFQFSVTEQKDENQLNSINITNDAIRYNAYNNTTNVKIEGSSGINSKNNDLISQSLKALEIDLKENLVIDNSVSDFNLISQLNESMKTIQPVSETGSELDAQLKNDLAILVSDYMSAIKSTQPQDYEQNYFLKNDQNQSQKIQENLNKDFNCAGMLQKDESTKFYTCFDITETSSDVSDESKISNEKVRLDQPDVRPINCQLDQSQDYKNFRYLKSDPVFHFRTYMFRLLNKRPKVYYKRSETKSHHVLFAINKQCKDIDCNYESEEQIYTYYLNKSLKLLKQIKMINTLDQQGQAFNTCPKSGYSFQVLNSTPRYHNPCNDPTDNIEKFNVDTHSKNSANSFKDKLLSEQTDKHDDTSLHFSKSRIDTYKWSSQTQVNNNLINSINPKEKNDNYLPVSKSQLEIPEKKLIKSKDFVENLNLKRNMMPYEAISNILKTYKKFSFVNDEDFKSITSNSKSSLNYYNIQNNLNDNHTLLEDLNSKNLSCVKELLSEKNEIRSLKTAQDKIANTNDLNNEDYVNMNKVILQLNNRINKINKKISDSKKSDSSSQKDCMTNVDCNSNILINPKDISKFLNESNRTDVLNIEHKADIIEKAKSIDFTKKNDDNLEQMHYSMPNGNNASIGLNINKNKLYHKRTISTEVKSNLDKNLPKPGILSHRGFKKKYMQQQMEKNNLTIDAEISLIRKDLKQDITRQDMKIQKFDETFDNCDSSPSHIPYKKLLYNKKGNITDNTTEYSNRSIKNFLLTNEASPDDTNINLNKQKIDNKNNNKIHIDFKEMNQNSIILNMTNSAMSTPNAVVLRRYNMLGSSFQPELSQSNKFSLQNNSPKMTKKIEEISSSNEINPRNVNINKKEKFRNKDKIKNIFQNKVNSTIVNLLEQKKLTRNISTKKSTNDKGNSLDPIKLKKISLKDLITHRKINLKKEEQVKGKSIEKKKTITKEKFSDFIDRQNKWLKRSRSKKKEQSEDLNKAITKISNTYETIRKSDNSLRKSDNSLRKSDNSLRKSTESISKSKLKKSTTADKVSTNKKLLTINAKSSEKNTWSPEKNTLNVANILLTGKSNITRTNFFQAKSKKKDRNKD